jgi:acetylornithine deacetylase/succinyl-diaminopimelate desuccinylase-like protein
MTRITDEEATRLVCDLVALPTVNTMGRPYCGALPVERPVVEYLERMFAPFGVKMERQACSRDHESLLVVVPGKADGPATLFESHADTVPADDWPDRAFTPRVQDGHVVGRGACDDKGPLAAMVLAVCDLLSSGERPPQTVLLLAAGDEECGQTGIKAFADSVIPSAGCAAAWNVGRGVFGEPTSVRPVVQHKGTIRWDVTVRGKSAHSSQPELGTSAILGMLRVIECLQQKTADLRRRFPNPLMTGPALTATMIRGGRTRNAVPDECTLAVDFRIVPGMDREAAIKEVFAAIAELGLEVEHSDFQCFAPALCTSPDDPLTRQALVFCSEELGQPLAPAGAPYGSDACYMPQGKPAIVLGPGSIDFAHAVDERVPIAEVVQCARVYRKLMTHDWR